MLSRLENLVTTQGGHVRGSLELCNKRLGRGAVSLQVLSPCDEIAKTWGANDASLVLHIRYGSRAILLTGDIEGPAEQHLLRTQREQLSADVLKVAHHGSDTSSNPDFVAAVAPRIALISSGIRNRFRHPRPDTLETLDAQGTEIFRTDQLGSISWSTDGQLQEMRAFFAPPRP